MSLTHPGRAAPNPDAPDTGSPPHRHGRLIVGAMLVSTFMAAVEVTVISTAMPTIVGELGGFELFTWAFGIYLLTQAVMTPIYGRMADGFGRRRVYIGSVLVFLVGSLLCGCAWSMGSLIVFRAIQGLGGGGLVPMGSIIISDVTPPAGRARALGWVSGVWGIAAIVGPLLGSFFVGTLGWPFVFWVNLPIGLVTMALVARYLHEPAPSGQRTKLDLAGAGLLALGIGAIMAALVQHEAFGRTGLPLLVAVGLAALAGFAVRERRAAIPILPLHLWRTPMIVAGNLSALLCGMLLIGATAFLPSWTEGVMGRSALVAGVVLGVLTISWTSASIGASRMMTRLAYRPVALAGSASLIVGTVGFALLRPEHGAAWVALAGALTGVGLGLHALVFNVAIQTGTAREDRGRATSLFFFCRLLGQALGAAAFGGVLNAGLTRAGPAAHDAVRDLIEPAHRLALAPSELERLTAALGGALHGVFLLGAGVAVATLLVGMLVPRGARLAAAG
jgi:EmrB/QacA subfamily drug resistance transporter